MLQLFIVPLGSLSPLLGKTKRAAAPGTITLRIAVLIAGLLIAAAILISFRWQISAATGVVYRLDRWTGNIIACELNPGPCYSMMR